MFKKILVPLGDSPDTLQALHNAWELSKIYGAEIHGLFITDEEKIRAAYISCFQMANPLGGLEFSDECVIIDSVKEDLKKEEKDSIEIFEDFKKNCTKVPVSLEKAHGIIWEEIIEKEEEFDLVVMGKSLFNGEEASGYLNHTLKAVLHKSILPVLICTKAHPVGKNLLACYDGKRNSIKSLIIATSLSKKYNVPLSILTINYNLKRAEIINKEGIRIALENDVTDLNPIIHKGNYVEIIKEEIKKGNINFIFMGAYGDNPIKNFILGSTTEGVLKETDCPVMLYR